MHHVNTSSINLLIYLINQLKSFTSNNFIHTTHGRFWSNPYKSGMFLTVPKQSSGLSVGSPLIQHWFHFLKPYTHGHFRPHTYQNTIYCINYIKRCPNSPWTVQTRLQKFQQLGPKFWDRSTRSFKASKTTQSSTKHLNKV